MSYQYTKGLPVDPSGQMMQEYPAPRLALQRLTSENAAASSVISATHDTTALEVTAVGAGAVLRWVAAADTQGSVISAAGSTSNYDHVIPPNALRRFAIPIERQGMSPGSVQGANRLNGLYQRYAIKSVGAASIMVSEF